MFDTTVLAYTLGIDCTILCGTKWDASCGTELGGGDVDMVGEGLLVWADGFGAVEAIIISNL